jgi:hypothetical protein
MSLVDDAISQLGLDISPIWTSSLKRKSEHYNPAWFILYGRVQFLCWYYTDASFKCCFFSVRSYLEFKIFVCLNFNPRYLLYI